MRSANAFNFEKVTLMPTTGIVAYIFASMPYAVPTAQMSEMFFTARSVGKEVLGKRNIRQQP